MALSHLLEHDFSKFRARRDLRVKPCIRPHFIREQFGHILANVLFSGEQVKLLLETLLPLSAHSY